MGTIRLADESVSSAEVMGKFVTLWVASELLLAVELAVFRFELTSEPL